MVLSKGIVLSGAIVVAAVATGALPANAGPNVLVTGTNKDVLTREVSYRDLNLASRTGKNKFIRRVGAAVDDVCNELSPPGRVHIQTLCRTDAWRSVRPQIAQVVRQSQQVAGTGQSLVGVGAVTLIFSK